MNNKFKGVYLFSDIDGTFASEENFIPKKNLEALEYFTKNGGTFSIATGRYLGDLDLLKGININGISIINNGASIYDFANEKELKSITLNDVDVNQVFDFLDIHKNIGLVVVNKEGYINAEIDLEDRPIFHDRYKTVKIKDIKRPFNKMLLSVKKGQTTQILKALKEFNLTSADFVETGDRSIEIVPKGINKGTAFLEICKLNNIENENTFFIGDSFNDIEFMKLAGFSAAVGTAKDKVKENAKIVVCDFKDGAVADFISFIEKTRDI